MKAKLILDEDGNEKLEHQLDLDRDKQSLKALIEMKRHDIKIEADAEPSDKNEPRPKI